VLAFEKPEEELVILYHGIDPDYPFHHKTSSFISEGFIIRQ
jgi:hypothetical protein